jgi:hypothetical protein
MLSENKKILIYLIANQNKMPGSRPRRRSSRRKKTFLDRMLELLGLIRRRRVHPVKPHPGIDYSGYQKYKEQTKGFSDKDETGKIEAKHSRSSDSSYSREVKKKQKEQKREERAKLKLKKKIRKRQRKEYKKAETGRSIREKLLMVSGEEKEEEIKKRARLFSKRSALFHNYVYIINSTAIYILTFIITYLIYWLTEMFMASLYGIDSILYYYDLRFNDYSPLWTRFNILVITGTPPFVSLFVGLLIHRRLFKLKRFSSIQKLFLLWWSLHSLNHFFGAFASGIVTDEGFGYVAAWLYMNTAFKFMFAIVALFALGVFGYYSKQHILETSNSQSRIKRQNQASFIFTQALIPWILGTGILVATRIPHNFDYPYETLLLFSMAFLVIPAFFNPKVKPKLNLLKLRKKYKISPSYIILMLLLLAFYRIVLDIGLHFIIKISISISPANI